ncbi:MAG TPA: hypothetical protein VHL98_02605 [Microvirga sp.]|jgi:hypothetical protein|nr:hypothetical protein [Microvirga sp.]
MNVWRSLHPSLRVGAVMGALGLALLAAKGAPPIFAAQARTAPAAASVAAAKPARAEIAPFRMLPSDLAPGGASQHAPTKGPFLGPRRNAP